VNKLKQDIQVVQTSDTLFLAQRSEQTKSSGSTQRLHLADRNYSNLLRSSDDGDREQSYAPSSTEIEETGIEAGSLVRLLEALTLNSTVEGALTTFFSFLPEKERKARTALVLTQMGETLPTDIIEKLKRTHSFVTCTPEGTHQAKLSLFPDLASTGIVAMSGIASVFMFIGAFAAYRHIATNLHPPELAEIFLRVLRNMFLMVCTWARHSRNV
jgi:hypothetical protein